MTQNNQHLAAAYQIMSIGAEPIPIRQMMAKALSSALSAVNANAGAIYLIEKEQGPFELSAVEGLNPNAVARLHNLPSDKSLPSWILENEEVLIVDNVQQDWRTSTAIQNTELSAYIGIPIHDRAGNAVGALNCFRQKSFPFDSAEIELLTSVADQIGVILENSKLRTQQDQLLVLAERNRLARELHDAVTQSLYSLTLFAEVNERMLDAGNYVEARDYTAKMSATARQALKEMRLMLHNLRPPILEKEGLVNAIRHRLQAVESRAGITARCIAETPMKLPHDVEISLYHLIQEALNNSLKHSDATDIKIQMLQTSSVVIISIADNGVGFELAAIDGNIGMGLNNMRERAQLLGGELQIMSATDLGTEITIEIPNEYTIQ